METMRFFFLYLQYLYQKYQENEKFKNYFLLHFFAIYGLFHSETLGASKPRELYQNILYMLFCRGFWREQKSLDSFVLILLLEIVFGHLWQMKRELMQANPKIDQLLFLSY